MRNSFNSLAQQVVSIVSLQADIYSFAISSYEIVARKSAFASTITEVITNSVLRGARPSLEKTPLQQVLNEVAALKDFVKNLLNKH